MHALDTLLQREQNERDQAQSSLRLAEESMQRAQQQAQQLAAYRIDYQARWASEFSQGATMQILQCYRSFMQRLDQAVKQQAQLAEQAGEQVTRARSQLLQREQRLASVLKLIERQCAELQRAGRRHEQKHIDELAQRMHKGRAGDGGPTPSAWP